MSNLPLLSSIFPDYFAPIVRNHPEGRELMMARWGMPSPAFAPHWRRWLGIENRCVVPWTSFSEHEVLPREEHAPVLPA